MSVQIGKQTPFGPWKKGMHLGPWVLLGLASQDETFLMFEAKDRALDRPILLVFSWEGEESLVDLHYSWRDFSGPPLPRVLQLNEISGPEGDPLPCLVLEGTQGIPFPFDLPRTRVIEIGIQLSLALQELLDLGLSPPRLSSMEVRLEKERGIFLLPPFPPKDGPPPPEEVIKKLAEFLLLGLTGSSMGPPVLKGLPRDLKEVLSRALGRGHDKRYPSPQKFGMDLRRVLAHETIHLSSQKNGALFSQILKACLGLAIVLLFVFTFVRFIREKSRSIALEQRKVESFGSLLGDFHAKLDKGQFPAAGQFLKHLERMGLPQGKESLAQARGAFQRKILGHLAEVISLSEAPAHLQGLQKLAGETAFLDWVSSVLRPKPRIAFLKRIERASLKAHCASSLLQDLPSLSECLQGDGPLVGFSMKELRKEFLNFCRKAPNLLPPTIQIFSQLRKSLKGRRGFLLFLEIFLALPQSLQQVWFQSWLPNASEEEILYLCMSHAFRDRKKALPLLSKVSRFLEEKQNLVLDGRFLIHYKVAQKVIRELRSLYPPESMWDFWGSHYPLFEKALPKYPLTLGSAILLLRGILDPKKSQGAWIPWVRQGDVRVFFYKEFCGDPTLDEEAENLARIFLGLPGIKSPKPLFFQHSLFRDHFPLPLLFFNHPGSRLSQILDDRLCSLLWKKGLKGLGETMGINRFALERMQSFPEENWALPFFEALLRVFREQRGLVWNFFFVGRGTQYGFGILAKPKAFQALDERVADILQSGRMMEQRYCLGLLCKVAQERKLAPVWIPRLRSYLNRVASPSLKSLALSCLEEFGDEEMRTFFDLRKSFLPEVRKRAWKWLFQGRNLEKAWDSLGGQEPPTVLIPPPGDRAMVEALFLKRSRGGKKGGSGNPSKPAAEKSPLLLSSRRAHYFKVLESLQNR